MAVFTTGDVGCVGDGAGAGAGAAAGAGLGSDDVLGDESAGADGDDSPLEGRRRAPPNRTRGGGPRKRSWLACPRGERSLGLLPTICSITPRTPAIAATPRL